MKKLLASLLLLLASGIGLSQAQTNTSSCLQNSAGCVTTTIGGVTYVVGLNVQPGAPLTFSPSSGALTPQATVGTQYSGQITASGGTPPYTYSLPTVTPNTGAWLAINPTTGALTGNPGTAETESISVKVTDCATPTAHVATGTLTLVVNAASNPISISNLSPLPAATVATAYSVGLSQAGGVMGASTWSLSVPVTCAAGSSSWLTINSTTGVLSGTPATATTCTFQAQVNDNSGHIAQKNFTLTVNATTAINLQATGHPRTDAETHCRIG